MTALVCLATVAVWLAIGLYISRWYWRKEAPRLPRYGYGYGDERTDLMVKCGCIVFFWLWMGLWYLAVDLVRRFYNVGLEVDDDE